MSASASELRGRGAYFTPSPAADAVARWVLTGRGATGPVRSILEPSMGDGAFVTAIATAAQAMSAEPPPEVWGVELDRATFARVVASGVLAADHARLGDFLAQRPFPVDAVVGNPPYVRLRHLPDAQAQRATAVAAEVLGEPMGTSGSVWMPFVLHACRFLRPGGRLALVLPYDCTYVRYARRLWRHLGRSFGSLRVVRVRQRMFPELLQEVVLLLADEFGGSTDHIDFAAYESLTDLTEHRPTVTRQVAIAQVVGGERAFLEALLSDEVEALLRRLTASTRSARETISFHIGYVTGDKSFFHPSPRTIAEFELPGERLLPALTSSRQLSSAGLRTSSIDADRVDRLYLPHAEQLTAGERRYLDGGRAAGVDQRYKCRVREPWFVTPGVRRPDVVVTVFAERPAMLINDAELVASNSLLCGYLRPGESDEAAVASWYTSLTLLQIELQVHSLGGGVMVLVPGEAGGLRLATNGCTEGLPAVDAALRAGRVDAAFRCGDVPVLQRQLGLSPDECELIRDAASVLASWRTAFRSSAAGRGRAGQASEIADETTG